MFDFLYQCINAQSGGSGHAGQPMLQAVLGVSLRGLILLSSRAHGKAGKYSLFKDLASKGFGDLWREDQAAARSSRISLPTRQLRPHPAGKKDKKNPDTVVPGLIHTNEEGGGDIVTCCKTSVEFNIAKRFVHCNNDCEIYL
ncbi:MULTISPECIES: hypothetical protein [Herbaspirillum]|uniref:Uncharacterized protein n=1 Tax=Herbaspirillum frisingense TaxID=92645 RepID=A0ABU1PBB0_9BURK|nr:MULTISPECIES: hypothetical protein [Herbaspirillum]MDR6583129.1 hypothetical protein [Herbaspirillum frisingense]